jgi:hypothetical protein
MSARSIGKHEIAVAPNDTSILLTCGRVDDDLGSFLHLVGHRPGNFGLAFYRPKGAATDNGIWDVKVGDLSSIAAIVGRLPFRSDILNDGRGIVCISWTADQNDY